MKLSELQLQVAPGDGLVTNLGPVVFVVLPAVGQEHQFVDDLAGVVETVTSGSGPDVGRPLIRELAGLITSTPAHRVLPFGLVAETADSLAAMVFGPADLSVFMADGRHELVSGADATMWVDRLIHGEVARISVVPSGTVPAPAHPRHDLRLGTVPASGFSLVARGAPTTTASAAPSAAESFAPPVEPVAAPAESFGPPPVDPFAAPHVDPFAPPPAEPVAAPAESFGPPPVDPFAAPHVDPFAPPPAEPFPRPVEPFTPQAEPLAPPAEPFAQRAEAFAPPLQPAAEPAGLPESVTTPTDVQSEPPAEQQATPASNDGSTDQFVAVVLTTPPAATRDALPLASDASGAADHPEPGRLVLKDGRSITLDGRLLLGRSPEHAPDVIEGRAVPLVLPDTTRAISRVHASIAVENGVVTVTDLESANGTGLAQAGDQTWTRLTPGQPAVLLPGGRVLVGDEEMTYVLDLPVEEEPEEPDPIAALDSPRTTVTRRRSPEDADNGVGDYVFVRPLGRGGRGGLFLAVPPSRLGLDVEYVAVKLFTGATSDDAFRRAARELRAVAAANSPYLVKIYDAGQDNGRLFYCMDYFPEGALAKPTHPLTRDGVVHAVAQAARGAHALHEVGVVHQGIKPRNILLGHDHAYLSDLGVVQPIAPGQSVTSLSTGLGDLEYLDPSILTGGRGTRATDIWSLAATLHFGLTGMPIYNDLPSGSLLAIRTVLTQRPKLSPTLRPDEAEAIWSCLDEDPAGRPPTALAFAELIEGLLDEPNAR